MNHAALWDAENEHPRDLLEMLEGDLLAGRIDRKWRLFCCACARRVISVSGTVATAFMLSAAEQFADGTLEFAKFQLAHEHFAYSTITKNDHAHASVRYAAYLTRHKELFHATCFLIENAAAAFPDQDHEYALQAAFFKDIFGNPFRPVAFDPAWRTDTAVAIARTMYDAREFGAMPILADALQDAGCEDEQVLSHCRDANAIHVRGCWVCDLVLGQA